MCANEQDCQCTHSPYRQVNDENMDDLNDSEDLDAMQLESRNLRYGAAAEEAVESDLEEDELIDLQCSRQLDRRLALSLGLKVSDTVLVLRSFSL